jgi:hypothetical protein
MMQDQVSKYSTDAESAWVVAHTAWRLTSVCPIPAHLVLHAVPLPDGCVPLLHSLITLILGIGSLKHSSTNTNTTPAHNTHSL